MQLIHKIQSFALLTGCLLFAGLFNSATAQTVYKAHLSGSNEVSPIQTRAYGEVTATLNGSDLTIDGNFTDLEGDFTASHIHAAMAGKNGGVEITLDVTADADSKGGMYTDGSNTFTLTAAQLETLTERGMYINVHTDKYPGGELRGQLVPESDAVFRANVSAAYQTAPTKSEGHGSFILELDGDSLFVSGSFDNLGSPLATSVAGGSHLHIGYAGENGGIMKSLTVTLDDDNQGGTYLAADNRFGLESDQKAALMDRRVYVNIHSEEFNSGELRGNAVPAANTAFFARLEGNTETPPVNTEATGAVMVEFKPGDSLKVTGSFSGLESGFDTDVAGGSHLHIAHSGSNGAITIDLNASSADGDTSGVYAASENAFAANFEQKESLFNRLMYVNIHTEENGGGELRGQVLGEATAYFFTNLYGTHEVQPIMSDASGALNIEYSSGSIMVSGSFSGLSSEVATSIAGGAHLHNGPVSGNGGVELAINPSVANDGLSGTFEISDNMLSVSSDQADLLYSGSLYANIHTADFQGGELRGQVLLNPDSYPEQPALTAPADGAALTLSNDINTAFSASWDAVSDNSPELAYIWQLSADAEFNSMVVNANLGASTQFETTHGAVDSLLADAGVDAGGTATVYHRVIATDGSNDSYSNVRTVEITRLSASSIGSFEGMLSGSNESNPVTTMASGKVMAELRGNELTLTGSFSDLSTDYSASHIHTGMAGESGGVTITLNPTVDGDSRGGTFEAENNTFTLTAEQKMMLQSRELYVNIHTPNHPAGELRAQLLPKSDAYYRANLSGAFEQPAAKTMASGAVNVELRGDSIYVSGTFSNLSDQFDANVAGGSHLHIAPAGSNGSIAVNLNAMTSDDNLSGTYMAEDNTFFATEELKTAMMNRSVYVNIHTMAYGGGELRGQLVSAASTGFFAQLSGETEFPVVTTDAFGAVLVEYENDTVRVSGSFNDLGSELATDIAGGTHLHIGHSGENGSVTIALTADASDDLLSGQYNVSKNEYAVNIEQAEALFDRMMYVNIHTANNQGGELRGQVLGDAKAYFYSRLSGIHEVQPITSTGTGALSVEINGSSALVTGGFAELTSKFAASIAGGSHLHAGLVSGNGGIEISLNATVSEDSLSGMYALENNVFSLSEAQMTTLFEGGMYSNIHTAGFNGGELRGQVVFAPNSAPSQIMITSPADEATISISGDASTVFETEWDAATDANGNELAYIWQLSTDAEFGNIVINSNVGNQQTFTTDYGSVDELLDGLGVTVGSATAVYHRVVVTDGSNESYSEPKSVTLDRGMLTANEGEQLQPEVFALEQNYPNPFNPSTQVSFSLSESGNAKLTVYNVLGQQVAVLVNEKLSAGSHDITFNAGQLSSGIYIYRLEANGNAMTKRMTLIK